jgi:hypothetical protein
LDEAIRHHLEIPATPPPEVLDALDRAARVLAELDRRQVLLAIRHNEENGAVSILVERLGADVRELSVISLLNLLEGKPG